MATPSKLFFFFMILVLSWNCKVKKPPIEPTTSTEISDDTPQILFLGYSIQEDESANVSIELINKIVNTGLLKEQLWTGGEGREGDLKCIALNAEEQAISYLILPNPLRESIEYEDENGNLVRKEIEHKKQEFFIRLQLEPEIKFIAVEQIGKPEKKYLITTKIEN